MTQSSLNPQTQQNINTSKLKVQHFNQKNTSISSQYNLPISSLSITMMMNLAVMENRI